MNNEQTSRENAGDTKNINSAVNKFKYTLAQKPELGALIALIIMCAVLSIISEYFLKVTNLLNISKQASVLAIVGVL